MTDLPTDRTAGSGTDPLIEVRGATIGYHGTPVLAAVDFTLSLGEVVALVGANGSGKSTLVRGLLGLAQVTAGTVELFGQPLGRLPDRTRLGYVPQRHHPAGVVPCTVRELVGTGRLPRMRRLRPTSAADRRAVTAAMAAVGLADQAGTPVAHLSGGQQRRALIARALAGSPEVLVMDEPLAGVDQASQEALADALEGLVGRGATLLIVLHELGPLAPLVTRVVALRQGSVVYDGPPLPEVHAAYGGDAEHHHEHGGVELPGLGLRAPGGPNGDSD
jgi:zinc transport system ATP-binding protein